MAEMKGIKLCGECGNYDWKKHKCKIGCNDDSNAQASFYGDCPLPDVVPRVELDAMRGAANSYKMHYENAETEVERLEKILNYYALQYGTVKDQQEDTFRIKTKVAEQLLSEIKKEAHNKAVHPCGCKIDPYISLKVLDGIIQKYINEYYEEGKKDG